MQSYLPSHYPQRIRPNRRRRPAPTARQLCSRLFLVLLGIFILIAILMNTPISQPSGSSYWLFQGLPAESKFLAAAFVIDLKKAEIQNGAFQWVILYRD